jgi:hypothetical protein
MNLEQMPFRVLVKWLLFGVALLAAGVVGRWMAFGG